VGDPAPMLDVDSWIKGEEVKAFEPGKVYVVEFWATWCPPCVRAIPHLSELQRKHDKVTFIGVAASERKDADGSDKRLDNLKAFVEKQGEKMAYRVAYDSDRGMAKPWLVAAGRTSIPTAFIVNHETKIAWVGHPNKLGAELEKVLDAGTLRGKDVKPSDER
jgi:thiol-disulfide isomerase/thioredoxin